MVTFVATPIGNLGDITLRALETLRAADVIFCEDTRHTLRLLNHFEIKKPLVACHKFNERAAAQKLIGLAREGKEVAVVTDAGTPVVSDPGNILVQALREAGIAYTLAPGACAFVAALVLSGFPADRFAFLGFLRGKAGEKRALLQKYAGFEGTLLFLPLRPAGRGRRRRPSLRRFWRPPGLCRARDHEAARKRRAFFPRFRAPRRKAGRVRAARRGRAPRAKIALNALPPEEHVARYMEEGLSP